MSSPASPCTPVAVGFTSSRVLNLCRASYDLSSWSIQSLWSHQLSLAMANTRRQWQRAADAPDQKRRGQLGTAKARQAEARLTASGGRGAGSANSRRTGSPIEPHRRGPKQSCRRPGSRARSTDFVKAHHRLRPLLFHLVVVCCLQFFFVRFSDRHSPSLPAPQVQPTCFFTCLSLHTLP